MMMYMLLHFFVLTLLAEFLLRHVTDVNLVVFVNLGTEQIIIFLYFLFYI